jgi:hypothetical protein
MKKNGFQHAMEVMDVIKILQSNEVIIILLRKKFPKITM